MRPRYEEKKLICPKCEHITFMEEEKIENNQQSVSEFENNLKVMDSSESIESLPTATIECPKCKNNLAYWWMLQTRSADEATTQFFRCTKCNHTWRNYS